MNKELEIRAAKALGCGDTVDGTWFRIKDICELILPFVTPRNDYHDVILVAELKFTTSYDWSMLGIAYMAEKKMWKQLQFIEDSLENFFYLSSAEEITLGWVKELERNNE